MKLSKKIKSLIHKELILILKMKETEVIDHKIMILNDIL